MSIRKIGILSILLVLQLTAVGQVLPQLQAAVSRLEKGLQEKDSSFFTVDLADNFSVSTATWPASKWYIHQVLNRPVVTESITILSSRPVPQANGLNRLEVEVCEEGKNAFTTGILFNSDNKIVYIDYFDEMWGNFRYKPSVLKAVVPFEYSEKTIVLTIRLNDNDRPLRFLFDSGADGMAIRRNLVDSLGLVISRQQSTSVVGGDMQISISSGNTVHIDTLSFSHQSIAIFDEIHQGIDGIIGLNFAKAFILSFDFDRLLLSVYSMGSHSYEKGGEVIPLATSFGIAHIPASINLIGKGYTDGEFVIDTGAAYYLIAFSPYVRKNRMLLSGFKAEEQSTTVSLGKVTPVFSGKTQDFRIGENIHLKNMPITLQASSGDGASWDPKVDGSIGIALLSRYNFTINLLAKELYLIPNKRGGLEY